MTTPPPPESLNPTVTPAGVMERLDRIREQYRMGIINLEAFNQVLKYFQFPDAQGALWTVGGSSKNWYRWDGRAWQPGIPPAQLQLPGMPLDIVPASESPVLPPPARPAGPATQTCPKCGAANLGKKFCTKCGSKLG